MDSQRKIFSINGRVLGEVICKTLFKRVAPQHFFIRFQGFGISKTVLDQVYELGVEWIVFEYHNKENKSVYRIKLLDFVSRGIEWTDNSWNKPDKQIVCPLSEMLKAS